MFDGYHVPAGVCINSSKIRKAGRRTNNRKYQSSEPKFSLYKNGKHVADCGSLKEVGEVAGVSRDAAKKWHTGRTVSREGYTVEDIDD